MTYDVFIYEYGKPRRFAVFKKKEQVRAFFLRQRVIGLQHYACPKLKLCVNEQSSLLSSSSSAASGATTSQSMSWNQNWASHGGIFGSISDSFIMDEISTWSRTRATVMVPKSPVTDLVTSLMRRIPGLELKPNTSVSTGVGKNGRHFVHRRTPSWKR